MPPELLLLAQICTKSFVGWGFAPDPLAGLRGPTSKGTGGKGKEGEGRGEEGREGRGGKGKERKGRGEERRGGEGVLVKFWLGIHRCPEPLAALRESYF